MGSRWEFDPTNDYNFEMFSDENSFTDDTVCTIAVADAIAKGRDYGESIHEWCCLDETCQGTVPVAFWIINQSTSFEDALRRAVSLGADADTLGAIVGSIAEARWGIPDGMRQKVMEYLPGEMQNVILSTK